MKISPQGEVFDITRSYLFSMWIQIVILRKTLNFVILKRRLKRVFERVHSIGEKGN